MQFIIASVQWFFDVSYQWINFPWLSAYITHRNIVSILYGSWIFKQKRDSTLFMNMLFLKCIKLFWKQDSPVQNIYLFKGKESLSSLQNPASLYLQEKGKSWSKTGGNGVPGSLFFRKKSKKRKGKKPKQHRPWFHSLGIVYWRSRGKKVQKHCSTYLRSSLYL